MDPRKLFDQMVAEGDVVTERLAAVAAKTPNKTFIYYGEEDRSVSYAAFLDAASRLATGLQALGVAPDDRVSVLTRNSYVAALSMFAIWLAGGVYAPVNFMYRGKLLAYQLRDSQPKLLISDLAMADALAEIADEAPVADLVIHAPEPGDHDFGAPALPVALAAKSRVHRLADLLASSRQDSPVPRRYSDTANVVYTSGTTGPSKGVLLPFRWMNQYSFGYRKLFNAEDVIYCDLPLYHVGGAFFRVAKAVYLGATVALYDRFSPTAFWERIHRTGSTHVTLLDVMTPWLMSGPPSPRDRENTITKVHMQPLPAHHQAVAQRFGFDIVTAGFGQTETGGTFTSVIDEFPTSGGTPAGLWKGPSKAQMLQAATAYGMMVVPGDQPLGKGFMGKPSPLFEVEVHDEADNVSADGTAGQLVMRPRFPHMFLGGYLNKPEAMARGCAGFWFHTGDACVRDADGVFYFVDRMGGFFRVRGENVSSYQVEDLINDHPKVRATAVVPVPAAEGEEEDCAAFVQLMDGEALSLEEFMTFARMTMPRFMVPRHVRFVDALPLTATNKVEKYKLKQSLLAELAAERTAP